MDSLVPGGRDDHPGEEPPAGVFLLPSAVNAGSSEGGEPVKEAVECRVLPLLATTAPLEVVEDCEEELTQVVAGDHELGVNACWSTGL